MFSRLHAIKTWCGQRVHNVYHAITDELRHTWDDITSTKMNALFVLALMCCAFVLVGNVIILISYNLWLVSFPEVQVVHNSSQIAIQVVQMLFLMMFFTILFVIFVVYYGILPIWHVMTDTNRIRGPWYRFLMMFLSGFSNALCGLLATYSMTYTPQFIQAVLMCSIPFSAQAWTVVFIPEERQRNYLSLFFIVSFLFFIAGALLSSLWDFVHPGENGYHTPWSWTLIYIASCIVFGFWCVVQRLYLDAIIVKDDERAEDSIGDHATKHVSTIHEPVEQIDQDNITVNTTCSANVQTTTSPPLREGEVEEEHQQQQWKEKKEEEGRVETNTPQTSVYADVAGKMESNDNTREVEVSKRTNRYHHHSSSSNSNIVIAENENSNRNNANRERQNEEYECEYEEDETQATTQLLAEKRVWGSRDVDSMASKLMLIYVGITFQTIFSLLQFPADAIPWYGTSPSVLAAWRGFCESVNFTFNNWHVIRYGLLNALGYTMSFIGCTFLNENSPTLASVVLQLAGPVTSLMLIIHPQWNVFGQINYVGYKLGGVILLLIAAIFYHFWEQRSMRLLLQKFHNAKKEPEQPEV